jgi:transcriptional regulator with XRE-family HTH domain/tetratricopeptide (TPR) repeat protein
MAEWGVGAQLRAIRLDRGLTLEQLAEASGVSVRGISDIERGVRDRPRRSTIDVLCAALQVDVGTRRELAREQARRTRTESPAESVQPHRVRDFVGREAELHTIAEHLAGASRDGVPRTVIVAGPPGIGKTALAIEATQRLREPGSLPLFLDLLGPNPALARPALSVLQALLREVSGPDDRDPPSIMDECVARWQEMCARQDRIIVLDNAAEEAQVRPVLAGGSVRVVITSRRSLAGLEGVERIYLDPLASPDSIRLLHEIVPPGQRTDRDITELARLCSDLPLALRIAGNRIASQRSHTAADFVRRLRSEDQRLRALVAGDLSAEAAFRLSYDDLAPFTAHLFRNLCLIYGIMFDVPLVTVLMGADPLDVEEGLDELAELGLLEFIGQRRYRLHDLLRLFSWHELRREDEQFGEQAQARLRSWLLSTAALAGRMFSPDGEDSRLDLPEWLTDRAAADQWLRWNREQWWPAFQHTARLARDREVVEVADALHWYAPTWMAWNSWQALFSLSVEAARRTGDKGLESTQLSHLAWADLTEQKDARAALERAREALLAAHEAGDDLALGRASLCQGAALRSLENLEGAIRALNEATRAFDRVPYPDGAAQARSIAGGVLREAGRPADAIAALRPVVDLAASHYGAGDGAWTARGIHARLGIAESLLDMNQPAEALGEAALAREEAQAASLPAEIGGAHVLSARAARALGDEDLADGHIEAGLAQLGRGADASAGQVRDQLQALQR